MVQGRRRESVGRELRRGREAIAFKCPPAALVSGSKQRGNLGFGEARRARRRNNQGLAARGDDDEMPRDLQR